MIWIATLVNGRIDTQVCPRISSEIFDTLIVDLIDIVIEGSKYGTLTEVDLTFVLGKRLYTTDIWINMIDELLDRIVRGRKTDI